ncbi:excitatory amino acid transporter-like isoform X1 [Macrosteles quadrilineatus]|uniref:excitatory amino acid transporter-like isoform X1 n=1 Tax=Macrosteles quadrilineatus TaxID=74068 RepID=UPI0023E30812|nr:excitatory amino acid transporter-like isoform X1 [Macrosteles quadrilineatus]
MSSSSSQWSGSCLRRWLQDNLFLIATAAGVLGGLSTGLILRPMGLSEDTVILISYPGELFMRVLKLMILPFVISCLIIGTATINVRKNGRIAARTILYFISTSALNVALGLLLVITIHPGSPDFHSNITNVVDMRNTNLLDGFLDMGRNLVPDNIFQSAFEQTYTEYYTPGQNADNFSLEVVNVSDIAVPTKRRLSFRNGTNTLGIIFFCIIFGSVLGSIGPQKAIVIEFFTVIYQVLMKMLMGAIWFTPLGVGSIICGKMVSVADLSLTLTQLSWFILTMATGVLLYQLIILQLIYYVFVGKNPYTFYSGLGPAIVTAFATASKAAAFPVAFKLLDERLKVDSRISKFILPIGTINMDGTALFLSVSVCFLAQINNIALTVGDLLTLGLSCTAASMSSATVPSAALVLVLMLCSTVNAPTEDVSLLFAVDWFVDRMRTTNNLLGDCYACAVIESLSKKELSENFDDEENTHCYGSAFSCAADLKIPKNGHVKVDDSLEA